MRVYKKMYRLFSVLLVVAMLVTAMPLGVVKASAATTEFASGSGTEADPYLIKTAKHLNNVRDHLDAHYKLIADIEFAEEDFSEGSDFYNDGVGWEPIGGSSSDAFTGTFDGNGFAVKNLHVNIKDESEKVSTLCVGLFGYVKNGTIKNLGMEDGEICIDAKTKDSVIYAGGIAGYADHSAIKNCYNTNNINSNATSSSSYSANPYLGGIVGYATNSSDIRCCYNTGNIDANVKSFNTKTYAGGIIGFLDDSSQMSDCYNAGDITASVVASKASVYAFSYAGGIVGRLNGDVYTCYNVGGVSASSTYQSRAGGIAGIGGSLFNCYYLDNVSFGTGSDSYYPSASCVQCADEQMTKQATYTGFDFETVWEYVKGNCYKYPTLRGVDHIVENEVDFAGGIGTELRPYLIKTKEHLNNVRKYLDAHYKMIADIEFTDEDFAETGAFYNSGSGWLPIGDSLTYPFRGILDGNGHSIKNLVINCHATKSIAAGLFGENMGTIRNLGMENCDIYVSYYGKYAEAYVGGLAGKNYGYISNCYTTGSVVVDGLLGFCKVGGTAGRNYRTIKESYNMATVSATGAAGGITGENYSSSNSTIENCFNTGLITAKKHKDDSSSLAYAGGISGSASGTINCCYNVGSVVSSLIADGIAYINASNMTMTNCYYYNSITKGDSSYYSSNCTLEGMMNEASFKGFDFQNIWTMGGDEDYLYPELLNTPMDFTKESIGIEISSLPYKTEYYAGLETLDITGGKISVVYNNGTREEVALEEAMVSGYDNSQVGKQTLSVKYNNQTLSFDIEVLPLLYDHKITTDETITLEFSANKEFEFVLSDESIAKITKVQSNTIQWGSSIKMTSAATIAPLKPGYVVLRAVDSAGNILSKSLLLIEEGDHQFVLLRVLEDVSCTESGKELHKCKFCGYEEEKTIPNPGHTEVIDEAVDPTCTKTGLTEGKHCSVCAVTIIAQEVVPETGKHLWDSGSVDAAGNVHYECNTCDATRSKELLSIAITTLPNKLSYMEGDQVSLDGMVLTAYYDDGTNETVLFSEARWSGPNPGIETITVSYRSKSTTFTITVTARVPNSITTSKYTISQSNISKITAGTTVSALLSGLNEGSYCKVYKGNSEVSGSTAVGTGMVVKIMDGNTVKASYTVIVTGDTNGDGKITVTDMIAIKAHVLKKSTLSGAYATAADTNGDNGISITDFIQVKAKILGKGNIIAR